tara:strand:- start:7273 stop:7899 length:627 start_codon:yes stop_codon:yes gene_type:complete
MKRLIIIVFLLSSISLASQNFEGILVNSINYESKDSSVSSEQLNSLLGTKQFYAIKEGNYKSVFNGLFIKLQIYKNDENRNYSLTSKSDTLYYEDYSLNKDKVLSFKIEKNKDTIMGILCDLITVKSEKGKTSIYFSSNYKINPDLYKQHNYGNWNYIVSKIKALPIKTIQETEQFIMTSIATEITPMKLKDNVFEIQNKKRVAPAYW